MVVLFEEMCGTNNKIDISLYCRDRERGRKERRDIMKRYEIEMNEICLLDEIQLACWASHYYTTITISEYLCTISLVLT